MIAPALDLPPDLERLVVSFSVKRRGRVFDVAGTLKTASRKTIPFDARDCPSLSAAMSALEAAVAVAANS